MSNSDLKTDYNNHNKKLYEFLATSYDVSNLAGKIDAAKKGPMSLFNLRKMLNESNIA